jgi:hypothetical protein
VTETEDVTDAEEVILCGTCGTTLVAAEEFLGHFWRHELSQYRACFPAQHDSPWGSPADPDEGES